MRILILAHFYPPEMGGAAARLHGLARWLVRYGHQVTVITGFPNYPSGVVPAPYRGKLRVRETMDGVDVLRTWVYASSYRSKIRRLANYFSFVVSATVAGLTAARPYDVLVASSPPLFIGLPGLALARLWRIPFIFDIRDIWPKVAVEAGVFSPDDAIPRLGEHLASYLYAQADHIVTVTASKQEWLVAAGIPLSKLSVVTNGVDLDKVTVSEDGHKRAQLGLDGKFVVLYAGLIGAAQGVETAVTAADRLRDHQDIHFLIVGDGVRRTELVQQVQRLGLSNVTLLPHQPREDIPAFLAAADACLVPLANSNIAAAVPSKLFEAWACKRPVILSAVGEAAALVSQTGGGVVVPPGNRDRLAEAVLAMKGNPELLAAYAQRGYECVRQRFDRPMLAREMEQVLDQAISSHRSPVLS